MITLRAELVPQAIRECVQKGIKGAVIVSAGFAETGNEGRALQDEVTQLARQGGLRFVGPNCMGIWSSACNLDLALRNDVRKGDIAFVSQSGTFGIIFSRAAMNKGYGLSKFISVGNQGDLDVADYLEYLADDPDTKAIVLYLEGFADGRKLFKVAKKMNTKKPIVVYKAGKSQAIARMAMSHTAAIIGEDRIFDAMCQQVGFIRSDELLNSLDMAAILVRQPLAKGRRVGILGTGGQCVVLSDLCTSMGLEVPELREEDIPFIISDIEFPAHAPTPRNPVDFAGSGRTALMEAKVVNKLAQLDYIDILICNTPVSFHHLARTNPAMGEKIDSEAGALLAEIPQKFGKPVVTVGFAYSNYAGDLLRKTLMDAGIASLPTPEEAVKAMHTLVKYSEIKSKFSAEPEEASLEALIA